MNHDLVLLMEKNFTSVWCQRDTNSRMKSIENIYSADSRLHLGHQTTGHKAINHSLNKILRNMPAAYTFFKLKPIEINNDIGRLHWGLGPNIESIVVTGMDIAVFENGKIKSMYVFLD